MCICVYFSTLVHRLFYLILFCYPSSFCLLSLLYSKNILGPFKAFYYICAHAVPPQSFLICFFIFCSLLVLSSLFHNLQLCLYTNMLNTKRNDFIGLEVFSVLNKVICHNTHLCSSIVGYTDYIRVCDESVCASEKFINIAKVNNFSNSSKQLCRRRKRTTCSI